MFVPGAILSPFFSLSFSFLVLLKMVRERTEGSNDSYVSYPSSQASEGLR